VHPCVRVFFCLLDARSKLKAMLQLALLLVCLARGPQRSWAFAPPSQQRLCPPTRTAKGPRRLSSLLVEALDVAALPSTAISNSLTVALGSNADVTTLFSVATFAPQPLWLLMIVAPNWKWTRRVMEPWTPVVLLSLVHLAIVVISATQTDGTAPIGEFAQVFDAAGFPFADGPQRAMMGMMRYQNFVSEEWPHVLIWDLFVGRAIWLDGLKRDVFTPHSVLLTNLIGPPGLLLHCLTCLVTGKGLPPTEQEESSS